MQGPDNTQESPPAASVFEPPAVPANERTGIVAALSGMVTRIFTRLDLFGTFSAPPAPKKTTTELAADPTRMAADHSLMTWVRTALSMISFGFIIYKVFQGFQQSGTVLSGAAQMSVPIWRPGFIMAVVIMGLSILLFARVAFRVL